MLITISGLSGSGKSTAAKLLSAELGMPTVDVGTIFRRMASERGMDVIAFGRYAEEHPEIDRELDDAMVREAKQLGDLILQGRLAGWMTKLNELPATRIWVAASLRIRAERVAGREGISLEQALRDVAKRDRDNRDRYLRTYGLDLNDLTIYDIVVQTDNLSVRQVVSSLRKELSHVWPMKRKNPKKARRPSPKARPKRPPKARKRSLSSKRRKPRK